MQAHGPRNGNGLWKLEKARKPILPEASRGTSAADTVVDFWPPELQGNEFVWF